MWVYLKRFRYFALQAVSSLNPIRMRVFLTFQYLRAIYCQYRLEIAHEHVNMFNLKVQKVWASYIFAHGSYELFQSCGVNLPPLMRIGLTGKSAEKNSD